MVWELILSPYLLVAAVLYLLVALAAIVRTLSEANRSPAATRVGTLIGCIACLFWLPLLPVFLLMPKGAGRPNGVDLSSGL